MAVLAASEHEILRVVWSSPEALCGVWWCFWQIWPPGYRPLGSRGGASSPGGVPRASFCPGFAPRILEWDIEDSSTWWEDAQPARTALSRREGDCRKEEGEKLLPSEHPETLGVISGASADPELHPARNILLLGWHAKEAPARCGARGWESLRFHTELCTILCLFYIFFFCASSNDLTRR